MAELAKKTREELIAMCKEQKIKGYSKKNKEEIIQLLHVPAVLNATISTTTHLKMIDLFAGTGAFTYAFENTGKVECVFANDMVEWSKVIYDENFQHKLTLGDLNDLKVDTVPSHDLLTGGFPCFVQGTRVLTQKGYKPIEDVELSDSLLTHTGQFKKILNLQQKNYTGYLYELTIKYHPQPIICTEEHPFYTRRKHKKWNNDLRRYEYSFDPPTWKKANELTKNDYYGMVINTKKNIPEFIFEKPVNTYKKEKVSVELNKLDYWFVMGYLVGDGWIEESTKKDGRCMYKICFAINNADEVEIVERIRKVLPITDKNSTTGKCKKFGCSDFLWYNILKQFGNFAHGKCIPEWVQDAPTEYIQEFINGYMKADGCINKNNTVSYNLASGLQRLYLKLGHLFAINKCIRPKPCLIEGRVVNQLDTYCIRGVLHLCTIKSPTSSASFIEENYVWCAPFKITKKKTDIGEGEQCPVYNFEVEKDNSYIVENTIVHNCQPFSIAGKQEGFQDKRSNVFWKILEILDRHKPAYVILENVKNLVSHDEGKTFETIKKNLTDRGYHIRFKVLDTAEITGIPQHRERIYIVCIKSQVVFDKFTLDFPKLPKAPIASLLEQQVAEKYYYTDKSTTWDLVKSSVIKQNTVYQYRRVYVRENKSNECPTLTANMGGGGHNVPLILDAKGIRKLTPRECFNFQGFPASYKLPTLSDTNLYKLAGNAVSVPVVELIAKRLMGLLEA
jgi:DNA (cytosine-5)-methyltransferase 1